MQPVSEHEKRWTYLSQKYIDAMERQASQPVTFVGTKVTRFR
jgi:hypothetical protein